MKILQYTEYDALLIKVSQYWRMWRSDDENITVLRRLIGGKKITFLRNVTLCRYVPTFRRSMQPCSFRMVQENSVILWQSTQRNVLSVAVVGMSASRTFGLVFRVALKTKMSVERWWNDVDGAKNEVLGEKPVPFSLYRPKISHVFTRACPFDTSRWRWMWGVGGSILTGEMWSAGSKNCPNLTFITTDFTSTGPGSKPAVARLTYDTTFYSSNSSQ
jgi:hypothetical protein